MRFPDKYDDAKTQRERQKERLQLTRTNLDVVRRSNSLTELFPGFITLFYRNMAEARKHLSNYNNVSLAKAVLLYTAKEFNPFEETDLMRDLERVLNPSEED